MKIVILLQTFNSLNFSAIYLGGQHQAGQNRLTIDQHCACPALTQFATMLGTREPAFLTYHFQQGVMNREDNHVVFTIDMECSSGDFGLRLTCW